MRRGVCEGWGWISQCPSKSSSSLPSFLPDLLPGSPAGSPQVFLAGKHETVPAILVFAGTEPSLRSVCTPIPTTHQLTWSLWW